MSHQPRSVGRFIGAAALTGALCVCVCSSVRAQPGPTGTGSGGAPRVTTREAVEIQLSAIPHVNRERLQAFGARVQAQLPAIQTCYTTAVAARPTVTGVIRIRAFRERRTTDYETLENSALDEALTQCVDRAIRAISFRGLETPTGGIIVMTFDNSRAAGTAAAEAARAEAERVQIDRTGSLPQASYGTSEVNVTVRGEASATDQTMTDTVTLLRTALPNLFDCRRRAGRRGANPQGTTLVTLTLGPSRSTARVTQSTVADRRASACIEQGLTRLRATVPGTFSLSIVFAPNES